MVVNLTALILAIVVLPLAVFQTTVIIFLAAMKYRRVASYTSAFFTLFLMVCSIDLLAAVNNFFGLRLHTFEVFIPFYLSSPMLASVLYLGSAYELFTQCFIHLAIAINRYWAVRTAMNKKGSSVGDWGRKAIAILPFLAFVPLAPRFGYQAEFAEAANGAISPKYNDPWISKYQSTVAIIIIVSTAAITFLLEIVTVFYYRSLLSKNNMPSSQVYQDIRLLGQALIVLVAQMFLCTAQVLIFVATQQSNTALRLAALAQYSWISDLFNHTGAIALLVVSERIRRDYKEFYLGKSNIIRVITISKSVTVL